ncbi:MAG: glycyl-radical enzyme activating protein [Ruminococcaceae bacterium]|nr:glycyl-radical enzyme activating protein [Oscillospiraceae bacterium]
MKGTVFDIKEFSVYDGPGIRTTVFLKGCPLRCRWCHNPEGLSPRPQVMVSYSACADCGRCAVEGCSLSGGKKALTGSLSSCIACGKCVEKCPANLRKIAGKVYSSEELAEKIMKNSMFFEDGGGVTFSGGEPTMQAEFLLETLSLLPIHKAIQTCGFCETEIFKQIIERVDYLFFDIKHTDPEKHKLYTGVDNSLILKNLDEVIASRKPFTARIPLIKGVNDGIRNLTETARLLKDAAGLQRVELLPYSALAGAKYPMLGKDYVEVFDAPEEVDLSPFREFGIECKVMKGTASVKIK